MIGVSNLGFCLCPVNSARLTASQCLTHHWLRRRSAPPVSVAPATAALAVPPVVVQEPPSPQPLPLEVTKDNLRGFVERWGEHPNSPYVFDPACHSISLSSCIGLSGQSAHSMKVCSPSPHSSMPSSPDSVLEMDNDDFTHYSFPDAPTGVHSRFLDKLNMERRASDSSCLPLRASGQSQVNLADEIKRLSDRLCSLIAHDLVNNNASGPKFRLSEISRDVPRAKPDSPLRSLSSSSSQSAPSSPTRMSPEPLGVDNRKSMRWGQIEISVDSHSIRNIRNIFESTTTSSSEFKSSKKVVATGQKQSVPLKSL